MNQQALTKVLDLHAKWLREEAGGQQADLRGAYLRGAYLQGANLVGAYLRGAYLQGANLVGADLRGAYLQGANLVGAYLMRANLMGANLVGADLRGAYLVGADLRGAYLRGAYLQGANLVGAYLMRANLMGANLVGADLMGADLRGADIKGTVLDPEAKWTLPSPEEIHAAGMEIHDGVIHAWRTKHSQHCGDTVYTPGGHEAPYFSHCTETSCHPGIYFASEGWLRENYPVSDLVEVRVKVEDAIHVGGKWRARRVEVVP